ncbi:MAG: hypothetical protein HRT36_05560 [Alphaproteobacteria bacterium]|nr:hypothetical protein [Alphaproteobacteria bacterium]
METVEAEKADLEEEHGTDEGILSAVGNKREAEIARDEALELVWEPEQPETFGQYRTLLQDQDRLATRIAEISETDALKACENAKGRITQANVRIALAADLTVEKRVTLNDYMETAWATAGSKKQSKNLLKKASCRIFQAVNSEPEKVVYTDLKVVMEFLQLIERQVKLKADIKEAKTMLNKAAYEKYPTLTESEIKTLVVEDKWLASIDTLIHNEMDRISQALTQRVRTLAERYEMRMPDLIADVVALEAKVNGHLKKMGFAW